METEKLYYADPFAREFTARVLTCEAAGNGFAVTLDRTAFYPEGGGQPADHGTLGIAAVTDVHEKNGVIFHTCDRPVEIGAAVTGTLDWARRFDHMQQHSGEHILSGLLCARFRCDNVGFHLGADAVTIDFNADISREEAMETQEAANAEVEADLPVEITWPSREELAALDYRSKKELTGAVRIVTFPGADCCACCGTHVGRTGQVGLIQVLSVQKFRDGTRLEIVSGGRARRLLGNIYEQNRAAAQALSAKMPETAAAVERVLGELAEARARIAALEEQVFAAVAEKNAGRGDVLLVEGPMRPDAARRLADAVGRACGGLAAVFAGADGEKYNYALVRADGADFSPLVKALNGALRGRGGGRGGFAQGSAQASREEIETFFGHLSDAGAR